MEMGKQQITNNDENYGKSIGIMQHTEPPPKESSKTQHKTRIPWELYGAH